MLVRLVSMKEGSAVYHDLKCGRLFIVGTEKEKGKR